LNAGKEYRFSNWVEILPEKLAKKGAENPL
jgi:hypothetical protein